MRDTPAALPPALPGSDPAAVAAWADWRTERDLGLAEEHGWLTLTALHYLTASPQSFAGLPGVWFADIEGVHVQAAAAEGILPADMSRGIEAGQTPIDGTYTVDVTTSGSTVCAIAPGNIAIEVGLRSGRHILRVRDPKAPTYTEFAGVPTFAYDPSWVIDAPVRWFSQPVPDTVGSAQPGLKQAVTVNGEVDLTRDGETVTLRLIGVAPGSGTLTFTDTSAQTPAWRSLNVEGPTPPDPSASGQTVRLDFNRAYDLPSAFTAYGTCARPLEGNDVPFAVNAGEQTPR